jgi:hypothetical protein
MGSPCPSVGDQAPQSTFASRQTPAGWMSQSRVGRERDEARIPLRWEAKAHTATGGRPDLEVSKSTGQWAHGGQLPHNGCGRSCELGPL